MSIISSTAFGIQEENHFPPQVHEMMPGTAEIRKGYMYGSGKPGARDRHQRRDRRQVPDHRARNGGAYGTDRTVNGTVILP